MTTEDIIGCVLLGLLALISFSLKIWAFKEDAKSEVKNKGKKRFRMKHFHSMQDLLDWLNDPEKNELTSAYDSMLAGMIITVVTTGGLDILYEAEDYESE